MQCINSINSYYTSAHVVRFGGSACPPNKGSYLRDCLTVLHSGEGLELELFDTVRYACGGLDMSLLCMQCLWRSVCVGNAYTPHTHQRYNGYLCHPLISSWYFVSHDMHVTPSSLQVGPLTSAVEAGLSKCTTLQKLTVSGSLSSSVTAALLKAVTVNRSLKEVSLIGFDFGM